jgi:RNA polymerase sigma-70 factor (ECF subfamily)
MDEDNKLISDYLNGNSNAFSELVSKYLKSVYNFSFWFTRDPIISEDITQESFVKIWKNLDKFKDKQSFKIWLFSIVRNTAIDWMRKRKNVPFSDFVDDEGENNFEDSLVDDKPSPLEDVLSLERGEELETVINKLPIVYKEILVLHNIEGMAFAEISKILGQSINTVKSRHRRAILKLKNLI